jgi:hypothetical protein
VLVLRILEPAAAAVRTARASPARNRNGMCQLPDTEAEAISEAIEARRAALTGNGPSKPPTSILGLPKPARRLERREKVFGLGRPRALDRNSKIRIMHWARCLSRRTEKGRAYGIVSAKALAVLEALLWVGGARRSQTPANAGERIVGWRLIAQEPRQTRPRADGGGVGPCYPVRDAALAIPSNAVER